MTFLQLSPLIYHMLFSLPPRLSTYKLRAFRACSLSLSLSAGFPLFPYDTAQHVEPRYRVHYITRMYRYGRRRVYIATARRLLYEDNR